MPEPRVPVMGLIGGVGSGKSSIARWLAPRLPAYVLDADAAGHRALAREDVKQQIRVRFGPEVFDTDNHVRRDRLAARVFGSDEIQHTARRHLEEIVHPVIRRDLEQQIADARQAGQVRYVLLDAALLLEGGWASLCDAVVFVETPLERRLQRVAAGRGWSQEQLLRREASQLPLEAKRRAANFTVDNSGSLEESGAQVLNWIHAQASAF